MITETNVGLSKRTGLQQTEQDDLNHQDRWDTDGELQFPRFMMKEVHACQRPDAAAGGGQDEQCFLRNPPLIVNGPVLVGAVGNQRDDIQHNQIQNCSRIHIENPPVLKDAARRYDDSWPPFRHDDTASVCQ